MLLVLNREMARQVLGWAAPAGVGAGAPGSPSGHKVSASCLSSKLLPFIYRMGPGIACAPCNIRSHLFLSPYAPIQTQIEQRNIKKKKKKPGPCSSAAENPVKLTTIKGKTSSSFTASSLHSPTPSFIIFSWKKHVRIREGSGRLHTLVPWQPINHN